MSLEKTMVGEGADRDMKETKERLWEKYQNT